MSYEQTPLYKAVFTINNIVFLMLPSLIVLNIVVALHYHEQNNTAKTLVYELCQESRTTDRISEEQCGDAQDRLNIEYHCDHRNKSLNNHCWTETK